jgi:hypothetical protein
MPETTMDEFLRDNHDAILVAVQTSMRGDETMRRVATQRELSESDLASQVLGFWLQAIRTDLALGSTAALEQNMEWLVSLRNGHELPFDDAMVLRIFDGISAEIDARLDSEPLRLEYAAYREKVGGLIADAFPQANGGPQ